MPETSKTAEDIILFDNQGCVLELHWLLCWSEGLLSIADGG